MRCILAFACVLWMAGCSGSDFTPGRRTLVVTPEPSQLVVTTSMLQTATSEADYPTLDIVVSRYSRDSRDTITLRTSSIQYVDMANVAIPGTDVPQRAFPTPVTLVASAPDVPSQVRFPMALLTPAIANYLKDQSPPVTIAARVKFDGESTGGGPVQFTFHVPIQVQAGPASPAP
jgi:hypothetical protein